MTPTLQILQGDCRATLKTLPDESVHCVVTSPPYWGLRDYGCDGQIGLEKSLDDFIAQMVEVFREVRRVLRKDGTCWVNLGDTFNAYNANRGPSTGISDGNRGRGHPASRNGLTCATLKPKDLCGVPWRVAFALQQPYYAGRIRNALDRVWLAAMLDAEGCFFIHKRKAGTSSGAKFTRADGVNVIYDRLSDTYSPGVEVSNTHESIVKRCMEIARVGSISAQDSGRKQTLYRWTARGDDARMVAREVYPYLVGKSQQARIAAGCPTSGGVAESSHDALKGLHHGKATDVDFDAPDPALEPGWYLRQDVIWAKPNPMPESVRDRCTKAHEYLFLMTKAASYFWDAEAMKEPTAGTANPRASKSAIEAIKAKRAAGVGATESNADGIGVSPKLKGTQFQCAATSTLKNAIVVPVENRNRRSVWTVQSEPYSEAHFATYPPSLIRPCILAGCPVGGTVLDPFGGSGTTGQVALELGRSAILCELNPEYVKLIERRCAVTPGLALK